MGKWERYEPVKVLLAVEAFMEKDADKVSHWIDVPPGQAIEALVITNNNEQRIYIVTEDTPESFAWVHDRWPKLISEK